MNWIKRINRLFHRSAPKLKGTSRGRMKTRDISITFRMLAGFAGAVTRSHPAAHIEATLIDPTNPPTLYGQAVLIAAASQGARAILTSDSAITNIYGITVRPYPIQAPTATNFGAVAIGASAAPSAPGILDVLRSGYINVPVSGGGTPVKGGQVFVWVAASSGNHVLGGFETASSGSTIALPIQVCSWQGGVDASGVAELAFNI